MGKALAFPPRKAAFTLAEVLITLGIIGVVAAMTLPTLVTKNRDKELVSRVKKTYSNIQNATLLAQKDYGVIGDNSFLFDSAKGLAAVTSDFAKYFNGAKVCQSQATKGCGPYYYKVKYTYKRQASSGENIATGTSLSGPKIILNDGAILSVVELTPNCDNIRMENVYNSDGSLRKDQDGNLIKRQNHVKYCAIVVFDVNGPKNPNQFGADVYYGVTIYKSKMAPNFWYAAGGESLKNILTGNGNLIYTPYNIGEKFNF